MTADFYSFDMKFLGETATRIINEVKGLNRVVYDITSKPAGHDRVAVKIRTGGSPSRSELQKYCLELGSGEGLAQFWGRND
jgi:hypothetical protein